ncbi:MAG: orotate phosphoribosyltransferase [Candidatus Methylacidiphilales bacterium]|nr:orotate phosphoribosyltransferase [Candidatus Methylacidiphilales bacterium]
MSPEQILQTFRACGALLEGHFVLRSGLHSRQFFQCALLLKRPRLSSEICAALADKVRGLAFDCVVSPAMGGILVGHDVARHLDKPHIFAEKKDGQLVVRRFKIEPGTRFLVAEDVVTTGSAVKEVCEVVRAAGGVIAGVCSIVDRSGEATPDFGAPFTSLLKLQVETFPADRIPEDLQGIPATKPGS